MLRGRGAPTEINRRDKTRRRIGTRLQEAEHTDTCRPELEEGGSCCSNADQEQEGRRRRRGWDWMMALKTAGTRQKTWLHKTRLLLNLLEISSSMLRLLSGPKRVKVWFVELNRFSSYEAHLSVVVKASKGFGFSVYRVSNAQKTCSRVLSSDHRLRRVQK